MMSSSNQKKRKLTLATYVKRRNGVAFGEAGALLKMLYRSLGADSFAEFWQYWNPIFGYYLGRHVFVPLKNWLPPAIALIVTFIFCGALHDLVTTLVRGSIAFLFTPWFFVMGLGVVSGQFIQLNYSRYS